MLMGVQPKLIRPFLGRLVNIYAAKDMGESYELIVGAADRLSGTRVSSDTKDRNWSAVNWSQVRVISLLWKYCTYCR